MPQEFIVLRCWSCVVFQVHQVKKSNKWNCKLCGEKQSVRKVYGKGSGIDCRKHVQRLNLLRKDAEEQPLVDAGTSVDIQDVQFDDNNISTSVLAELQSWPGQLGEIASSRWSRYLDSESCRETETLEVDDTEVDVESFCLTKEFHTGRQFSKKAPKSRSYNARCDTLPPATSNRSSETTSSLQTSVRGSSTNAAGAFGFKPTQAGFQKGSDSKSREIGKSSATKRRFEDASSTSKQFTEDSRSSKWSKFLDDSQSSGQKVEDCYSENDDFISATETFTSSNNPTATSTGHMSCSSSRVGQMSPQRCGDLIFRTEQEVDSSSRTIGQMSYSTPTSVFTMNDNSLDDIIGTW